MANESPVSPGVWRSGFLAACGLAVALLAFGEEAGAQLSYSSGRTVAPAYEGFKVNPDGSYTLLFGYMNRNWEEELDIPVGNDNYFSPGPADVGQPTHFLPRRNRFIFEVRVPADFGDQELVWTLTSQGEERKAYGSLRQDMLVDNMIIASETGALGGGFSDPENRSNVAPVIELETDLVISAVVGQPITLTTRVTDDGLPITQAERRARAEAARAEEEPDEEEEPEEDVADAGDTEADAEAEEDDAAEEEEVSPEIQALQRWLRQPVRITVEKELGLHFTWFVYRGQAAATFDPIQIEPWEDSRAHHNSPWSPSWEAPPTPADNRWIVTVTFAEPGTYVLRGRADDGGLYADKEVTINVRPLVR